MIKEIICEAIEINKTYCNGEQEILLPKKVLELGVPTLKNNTYQKYSPMLRERFEMFGRWENATHGHWLGLDDMEIICRDDIADDFLACIKSQRIAAEQDWPNEASSLFKPERLSLFACSDITNEKIYLLWLDFEDEPELWVYDSNGESRYKNLEKYLIAYLDNDISASTQSWRA